jgi:hypothetical protein
MITCIPHIGRNPAKALAFRPDLAAPVAEAAAAVVLKRKTTTTHHFTATPHPNIHHSMTYPSNPAPLLLSPPRVPSSLYVSTHLYSSHLAFLNRKNKIKPGATK